MQQTAKLFSSTTVADQPRKDEECIVCLTYSDKKTWVTLPCRHGGHGECLSRWFNTQRWNEKDPSCPVCSAVCGIYRHSDYVSGPRPVVTYTTWQTRESDRHMDDQTLRWCKQHCRRCPTCRVWVEKNGGCHEMTCAHCDTCFCWVCGYKSCGWLCRKWRDLSAVVGPDEIIPFLAAVTILGLVGTVLCLMRLIWK